jgi:3-polyprenyl-4-hydroxybenzoate decarboxylase
LLYVFFPCDQSVFWSNTAIQAAKRKENGEYTTQQKDNDSRMISASQLLFNTTQAGQTVTAAQALIPASSWQLSSIRNSMGNPI